MNLKNSVFHNKRGIEPVIATVLLIVITIAIVGLIIAFLVPYIQKMIDKQTACQGVQLQIDNSGTCTNASETNIMVSFGADGAALSKVTVQLSKGGVISAWENTTVPGHNEAITYSFASTSTAEVNKVGVIPYVKYKLVEYACENGKAELVPVPSC